MSDRSSSMQQLVNWCWHLIPRSNPYHQRRLTHRYCQKKQKVKRLWIGAGVIILLNPTPPVAIVVALFTTFLAFSILDETS